MEILCGLSSTRHIIWAIRYLQQMTTHVYCPPPNPGGAGREVWFVFLGPGVTADKVGLSTNKLEPIPDLAAKLAEQLRPPIPPKSDTIDGHVPESQRIGA